jgi:hypothetical protein
MIRVVHPGSRIRMLTFFHPGSRIQGSKMHPARIPDPDPQHCKNMGLGSWIRDPEKICFRIPDPGVKKAPDPGSATLLKKRQANTKRPLYPLPHLNGSTVLPVLTKKHQKIKFTINQHLPTCLYIMMALVRVFERKRASCASESS